VFPEQLTGPMRRLEPHFDNLRPWQTKKIYYFPDASREDIFKGKGPSIAVTGISKATGKSYWRMALDAFRAHETQAKAYIDSFAKMSEEELEKTARENGWSQPQEFVLGKSLVGGSVTGDIFEGITPEPIPLAPAKASIMSAASEPEIAIQLAGPWEFYTQFRRAHGLENLPHPEPPEIGLQAGGTLVVPLWLRNETDSKQEIILTADLPAGWKVESGDGKYVVAAKQVAAVRVEISLPLLKDGTATKQEAQEVTVRGEANGKLIGAPKLRVELRKKALPQ